MKQGDTFELSFTATEAIYNSFIEAYNDRNPLHTDLNFAISKGFDKVVLHGNILNGFVSYFIGEGLPTENVMLISQNIDYHNPFHIGDKLNFIAKVKNISAAAQTIEFKFIFKNQLKKKVAKGMILIKTLE